MDEAIVNGPGEGERLEGEDRVYLVKVDAARAQPHRVRHRAELPGRQPRTSTSTTRTRSSSSRASSSSRSAARRISAAARDGGGRAARESSTPSRAPAAAAPASSTSTPPTPASSSSSAPARRGEDATFDSVDVDGPQEPGGGTVLGPGEGTTYAVGTATSVFKATREATAGVFSLAESTIQPGTSGPPPHSHRELLDSFYVLEGTLTVQVGDDEVEAPAGHVRLRAARRRAHVREPERRARALPQPQHARRLGGLHPRPGRRDARGRPARPAASWARSSPATTSSSRLARARRSA